MANLHHMFFSEEDEVAFFRFLERFVLEVYPRRVPRDWKPFRAAAANVAKLPEEDCYLAASEVGPVLVDKVKRGPDKGDWRVDEVGSPVIYYERCRKNEAGDLLSGTLWAELDVTQQTGRKNSAPDAFRKIFLEVEEYLKKQCRKSEPIGFHIGSKAARLFNEGLVLRDAEPQKQRRKGNVVRTGLVRPFR